MSISKRRDSYVISARFPKKVRGVGNVQNLDRATDDIRAHTLVSISSQQPGGVGAGLSSHFLCDKSLTVCIFLSLAAFKQRLETYVYDDKGPGPIN